MKYLDIYLIGFCIMEVLLVIAVIRNKNRMPEGAMPIMAASCAASWLAIVAILIGCLYGVTHKDLLKNMEDKE